MYSIQSASPGASLLPELIPRVVDDIPEVNLLLVAISPKSDEFPRVVI